MKEMVKIKYFSRKKNDDLSYCCKLKRKKAPLTKLNLVFFQLFIETSGLCSLYDNILRGKYIFMYVLSRMYLYLPPPHTQ